MGSTVADFIASGGEVGDAVIAGEERERELGVWGEVREHPGRSSSHGEW